MTIFQKIINREIPADILYEDHRVIAFYDIDPKGPGHFLVVPKIFSRNLIDIEESDYVYLMNIARKLAKEELIKQKLNAFNLVVNNNSQAGQEVFHTHIHIIPKK